MRLARSVAQGQPPYGLCNYRPRPPIPELTSMVCAQTLQLGDSYNGILT